MRIPSEQVTIWRRNKLIFLTFKPFLFHFFVEFFLWFNTILYLKLEATLDSNLCIYEEIETIYIKLNCLNEKAFFHLKILYGKGIPFLLYFNIYMTYKLFPNAILYSSEV